MSIRAKLFYRAFDILKSNSPNRKAVVVAQLAEWLLPRQEVPGSSVGDDKLIFWPKHNIHGFFMILFGLFDLIILFDCQSCYVNCQTENEQKN